MHRQTDDPVRVTSNRLGQEAVPAGIIVPDARSRLRYDEPTWIVTVPCGPGDPNAW
jgi:hypothetical protein